MLVDGKNTSCELCKLVSRYLAVFFVLILQCSLENDVCNKLYEFQRELPRPSKQYMLTALCHDLQNGKRFASVDEQLRVLHELIQVRRPLGYFSCSGYCYLASLYCMKYFKCVFEGMVGLYKFLQPSGFLFSLLASLIRRIIAVIAISVAYHI